MIRAGQLYHIYGFDGVEYYYEGIAKAIEPVREGGSVWRVRFRNYGATGFTSKLYERNIRTAWQKGNPEDHVAFANCAKFLGI